MLPSEKLNRLKYPNKLNIFWKLNSIWFSIQTLTDCNEFSPTVTIPVLAFFPSLFPLFAKVLFYFALFPPSHKLHYFLYEYNTCSFLTSTT